MSADNFLPLAEALRSIGYLIELDEVRRAQVMVAPDGPREPLRSSSRAWASNENASV